MLLQEFRSRLAMRAAKVAFADSFSRAVTLEPVGPAEAEEEEELAPRVPRAIKRHHTAPVLIVPPELGDEVEEGSVGGTASFDDQVQEPSSLWQHRGAHACTWAVGDEDAGQNVWDDEDDACSIGFSGSDRDPRTDGAPHEPFGISGISGISGRAISFESLQRLRAEEAPVDRHEAGRPRAPSKPRPTGGARRPRGQSKLEEAGFRRQVSGGEALRLQKQEAAFRRQVSVGEARRVPNNEAAFRRQISCGEARRPPKEEALLGHLAGSPVMAMRQRRQLVAATAMA